MSSLSLSKAWDEATASVKAGGQVLFLIAFLLMALPGAMLQAMIPAVTPGQVPPTGAWLLMVPVAILLSMLGTLAVMRLVLQPGASGGEALRHAGARLLPFLGAILLLGLAAAVVGFALVFVGVLLGGAPPTDGAGMGGPFLLTILLWAAIFLYFWARLLPITAVAAVEPLGPVALIRRAFALTRGHAAKMVGLALLAAVVVFVVTAAVGMIGGILIVLVAGEPAPGSISHFMVLLLSAALNTVIGIYFAALIARVYARLAESEPTSGI